MSVFMPVFFVFFLDFRCGISKSETELCLGWPDYYRNPCICTLWPLSSARGSGARVEILIESAH